MSFSTAAPNTCTFSSGSIFSCKASHLIYFSFGLSLIFKPSVHMNVKWYFTSLTEKLTPVICTESFESSIHSMDFITFFSKYLDSTVTSFYSLPLTFFRDWLKHKHKLGNIYTLDGVGDLFLIFYSPKEIQIGKWALHLGCLY